VCELQSNEKLIALLSHRALRLATCSIASPTQAGPFANHEAHCVSQWATTSARHLQLSELAPCSPPFPGWHSPPPPTPPHPRRDRERAGLEATVFTPVRSAQHPLPAAQQGRRQSQLPTFLATTAVSGNRHARSRSRWNRFATERGGRTTRAYNARLRGTRAALDRSGVKAGCGVATIAFGMGKLRQPDVRFVATRLPNDLEAYYQKPPRRPRRTASQCLDSAWAGDVPQRAASSTTRRRARPEYCWKHSKLEALIASPKRRLPAQVLLAHLGEKPRPCLLATGPLLEPRSGGPTVPPRKPLAVFRTASASAPPMCGDVLLVPAPHGFPLLVPAFSVTAIGNEPTGHGAACLRPSSRPPACQPCPRCQAACAGPRIGARPARGERRPELPLPPPRKSVVRPPHAQAMASDPSFADRPEPSRPEPKQAGRCRLLKP